MKGYIGILIFVGLLIIGGFYIYFRYEPMDVNYSNISISAELNNKKIKTGYVIETSQGRIEGNTSQTYELEKIPQETIRIYNKNLDNQNFYTDYRELNISNNQRIELKLESPSKIEIENSHMPEKVLVEISGKDLRKMRVCIDWSFAYIYVKAQTNLTMEGDCFEPVTLKDSDIKFNITYMVFPPEGPTNEDHISLDVSLDGFDDLNQTFKIR